MQTLVVIIIKMLFFLCKNKMSDSFSDASSVLSVPPVVKSKAWLSPGMKIFLKLTIPVICIVIAALVTLYYLHYKHETPSSEPAPPSSGSAPPSS